MISVISQKSAITVARELQRTMVHIEQSDLCDIEKISIINILSNLRDNIKIITPTTPNNPNGEVRRDEV